MKNAILNFLAIALFTLVGTSVNAQNFVTLKAGTVVSLQLNDEVSSDEVQVGNSLDFFVRSNVVVNGQVVIASGSIAEGWVKKVTKGCDGRCANITITVENVQTVDGQRIYLRSIPHKIKANCCSDCGNYPNAATLTVGANLSARVLNDAQINS